MHSMRRVDTCHRTRAGKAAAVPDGATGERLREGNPLRPGIQWRPARTGSRSQHIVLVTSSIEGEGKTTLA